MTYPDAAFLAINLSVLPAWALLVLLPNAQLTKAVVHSGLYTLGLGLFYSIQMGLVLFGGLGDPEAGLTSIDAIGAFFRSPVGVLAGWSHYLVFDLFVGAWIGRDGAKRGIPHLFTAPSMLLAFVFGPVGLFVYLIGRALMKKGGWHLDPI
ncbi:MAG: ABA4-like family protein [Pseudomonadota bacterium]